MKVSFSPETDSTNLVVVNLIADIREIPEEYYRLII